MVIRLIRKAKLIYSSSLNVRKVVERVTSSSFYFRIAKVKVKRQIEKDKEGPFNLVIETSNFCNARCLMCPYRKMRRPKKIMDEKTYEKIISRIKEEKLPINKVFFSGLGEPLLDPNLIERIRKIKSLGFSVRLYTNASLLTSKISRQLVKLEVEEINISFNGVNPEQYQKIMGLNFEKTLENINTLLETRRKSCRKKPFIQVSLVAIEENEKDIKKHVQYWRNKVDSVTVSLAHDWGGGIRINSKFEIRSSKLKRVYPCRSLWHTFVIDSRGNFVICCRDYESRYVLGNIHTHSFADIYKSPVLENFRRLHLEYSQKKFPSLCQKCNFPYQNGVEWFLPRFID